MSWLSHSELNSFPLLCRERVHVFIVEYTLTKVVILGPYMKALVVCIIIIGLFPNLHIWRNYTYTRHNVHITDKMCLKASSWSKGKHNRRLHINSQDHSIQSAEAGRLSSDNSIFQVNTVIKSSVKQNSPMPTGLMVSTSPPCREWGNSAKTKPISSNYDVHLHGL